MSAPAPAPYDFLAIGANASGGFHLYVTDANGRKIAAVWGPAAEKEATARLFSTSPQMLEALKDVESKIVDYEAGRINWRPDDFLMRVREAIAATVAPPIAPAAQVAHV